jgi:hypothetical protein
LLGTWKNTRTYNNNGSTSTETVITQYTFKADGTFIELTDKVYSDTPDTHNYSARKGTYSVDAEGNFTITYTDYADSIPSFSADGVTWIPEEHPYTFTGPALVIGNQLYLPGFLWIAQGSVSGIVGTWAIKGMNKMWNNDTQNYDQTYYKIEYLFNNDGTVKLNNYKSSDGTFGLPFSTITGTYSNGTLTMTINGSTSSNKVTVYNSKYLILGDETSVTAYAFIKQ